MIIYSGTQFHAYNPSKEASIDLGPVISDLLLKASENLKTDVKILTSLDLYHHLISHHKWQEVSKTYSLSDLVHHNGGFGKGLQSIWSKFKKSFEEGEKAVNREGLQKELQNYFSRFVKGVSVLEPFSMSTPLPSRESPFQLEALSNSSSSMTSHDFNDPLREQLTTKIENWSAHPQLSVELQIHIVNCIKRRAWGTSERELIVGLIWNLPESLHYYLQQAGINPSHVPHILNGIEHALFGMANKPLAGFKPAIKRAPFIEAESSLSKIPPQDVVKEVCRDLSAEEKIQDVTGREAIFEGITLFFDRKGMKNVILLGEAGVGKTAIAEALQWRISNRKFAANSTLASKRVLSLDIGALTANSSLRGQFEERLNAVIQYAEENQEVILFIDEVHLLIGAGLSQGSNMNGANLLKTALTRGKLRCIAATTEKEYKLYIANDEAFARRFQPVHLDEPDREMSIKILNGALPSLIKHYKNQVGLDFQVDPSAVVAAVDLSTGYLSAEQRQPAKAVKLLDTVFSLSAHLKEAVESRTRALLTCFLVKEGKRLHFIHSKQQLDGKVHLAATDYQESIKHQERAIDELRSYFPTAEESSLLLDQIYIRSFAIATLLLVGIGRRERELALSNLIKLVKMKINKEIFLSTFEGELRPLCEKNVTKEGVSKILNRLKPEEYQKSCVTSLNAYENFQQIATLLEEVIKARLPEEKVIQLQYILSDLEIWKENFLSYPYVSKNEKFSIKFRVPSRLLLQAKEHLNCKELMELYAIQLKAEKEIASLLSALDPQLPLYEQFEEVAKREIEYPLLHAVENHLDSLFENSYAVADKWISEMPTAKTHALLNRLEVLLHQEINPKATAARAREAAIELSKRLVDTLSIKGLEVDNFKRNPSSLGLTMLNQKFSSSFPSEWPKVQEKIERHLFLLKQLSLAKDNPRILSHCQSVLLNLLANFADDSIKSAIQSLSKIYARADRALERICLADERNPLVQECLTVLDWVASYALGKTVRSFSMRSMLKKLENDDMLSEDNELDMLFVNIKNEVYAFRAVKDQYVSWHSNNKEHAYVNQLLSLYSLLESSSSSSLRRATIGLQNTRRLLSLLTHLPFTRTGSKLERDIITPDRREELSKELSATLRSLKDISLFSSESNSIDEVAIEADASIPNKDEEDQFKQKIAEKVREIWESAKSLLFTGLNRSRLILPSLVGKIASEAKFILSDKALRKQVFSDANALVSGVKGLFSFELLQGGVAFAGFGALKSMFSSLGRLAIGSGHRTLAKKYLSRIVGNLRDQIADDDSELRFLLSGIPSVLGREMRDVAEDLTRVAVQALTIDAHRVAIQVHSETAVPVKLLLAKPDEAIRYMEREFPRRILGQPLAIQTIVEGVRNAANGMRDPSKPQGIYLLVGGTGNGKSLTGSTLRDFLTSSKLITYNMSEYGTPESVTSLIGSPKGYVNHQEGGKLVQDALLHPNAIFVFDEIDQADPAVLRLFYQIMESGKLQDSSGVEASFTKATLVMTTNYRSEKLNQLIGKFKFGISEISQTVKDHLSDYFSHRETFSPGKILVKLFKNPESYKAQVDFFALENLLQWLKEGLEAFPVKKTLMDKLAVNSAAIDADIIKMSESIESTEDESLQSKFTFLLLGIKDKLRGCSTSLEQSLMWDENDKIDVAQHNNWSSWIAETSLFNHFPQMRFLRKELSECIDSPRNHLGKSQRSSATEMVQSLSLFLHLAELNRKTTTGSSGSTNPALSIEETTSAIHDYLISLQNASLSLSDKRELRALLSKVDPLMPRQLFSSAWVNRVTSVVPYFPLTPPLMVKIAEMEWKKYAEYRGMQEYEIFSHPSALAFISDLVRPEVNDGARPVKRAIETQLGSLISFHREEGTLPAISRVFSLGGERLGLVDEKSLRLVNKHLETLLPGLVIDIHPQVVACLIETRSEQDIAEKVVNAFKDLIQGEEFRFSHLLDYGWDASFEEKSWRVSVYCQSGSEPLFFYTATHIESVESAIRAAYRELKMQGEVNWGYDVPLQLICAFGQEKLAKGELFYDFIKEKINNYLKKYPESMMIETSQIKALLQGESHV